MGRCAPTNEEKLKWLGEAVAVQPDRREAHYWLAIEYSARGIWNKAWGAARAAMSLPRPTQHYWNLVEAIYQWQSLDIYETASVCVGSTMRRKRLKRLGLRPKFQSFTQQGEGRKSHGKGDTNGFAWLKNPWKWNGFSLSITMTP